MDASFKSFILNRTGAFHLQETETLQDLWSGYGKIIRFELTGAPVNSVVVKHVQIPENLTHPIGWNNKLSHTRKLKSYEVESSWYASYSKKSSSRVPHCFGTLKRNEDVLIILEDLDAAGFSVRKNTVNWAEIVSCLTWLAKFHARFLGAHPSGLWEVGTYWHLQTRPQELEALKDINLKNAAVAINAKLNNARYKTFVHGDAKLANFCFSENGEVAGVDYQYVGGGCGIKDVAYFIGSCLQEKECERLETKILDSYFRALHKAMGKKNEALEREWRTLYAFAWADFHRFLKGWKPNHWKINSYSERITKTVINTL